MALKSVDRLSVLDGIIIAVGWSEDLFPCIVVGNESVKSQAIVRYYRPDLEPILGWEKAQTAGFRIAAVLTGRETPNNLIAVQFEDGKILIANSAPECRLPAILEAFVEHVEAKPDGSLIEVGSRARSGNTYRSLFPNLATYLGIDISEGPNVDLVADAHTLSSSVQQKFDFAFSVSVFEHLIMPWVAAFELNKTLNDGGIAYIQSHPTWPLHEQPWDFFRFSKEAWSGIFNTLTGFEIIDAGYDIEAAIVPINRGNLALQGIDTERTFLLSCCLIRKISEPRIDWSANPSAIYNLAYSH